MRRLRRGRHRLFQENDQEAEAEIEQRQHEEGVAIPHHHRLAMNDLGQLLHCHPLGVDPAPPPPRRRWVEMLSLSGAVVLPQVIRSCKREMCRSVRSFSTWLMIAS